MTKALCLDLKEVKKLAKGDQNSLIKATLPGGKYSEETCDMKCGKCQKPCIDKKYMM